MKKFDPVVPSWLKKAQIEMFSFILKEFVFAPFVCLYVSFSPVCHIEENQSKAR